MPAFDAATVPVALEHAALVVLGGGYLPDDDDRAPWLAPTRSLVAQALDAGVPMLGICLGGQMLASVAGGAVEADCGRPEFGSTRIRLATTSAADPLFVGLPEEVTAIEHHVDEISRLPAGATLLASSDQCAHQAFRVGERAWGVQFHPEASADDVAGWSAARLAARGLDGDAVRRRAVQDEPTAAPVWREVADRFAAIVRDSAR